jgi:hypothetical protein
MPSACAPRRKAGDYRKRGPFGIARLRALAATPPQGPARRRRWAVKLHGMTDTANALLEITGETVREVCRLAVAPEGQRFFPGRLVINRAGAPGPRRPTCGAQAADRARPRAPGQGPAVHIARPIGRCAGPILFAAGLAPRWRGGRRTPDGAAAIARAARVAAP